MPPALSAVDRKNIASALALASILGYAIWQHPGFAEFANAIEWLLGIYITGHAATSGISAIAGQRKPAPKPPEGE